MTRHPDNSGQYFPTMFSMIATVLILMSLTGYACQSTPASDPPDAPQTRTDPAPADAETVEDVEDDQEVVEVVPDSQPDSVIAFVDRLEAHGKTISTLSGLIIYRKVDSLLNRHETRTGSFLYQARHEDAPERLAVRFDQLLVNNVRRPRKREYVFDGIWLTELDEDRKTIIRRQLAPEGQPIDLEGGGPIPLLAGHSREMLMKRYDISEFDPATDQWTQSLAEGGRPVRGLRFKPRIEASDPGDTTSIEVVFDLDSLLPAAIIDTQMNGNRKLFRLSDVEIDPELDDQTRSKLLRGMPSPVPSGWKVHVEPLASPSPEGVR
ncbi:MAG: hypothetical protein CMJ39_12065 [Phycisphaerae bacterium]|nr:hypothetical protein [Phycisphaerae bacterium]|tara:strand:+ start:1389 stop:2354 length:966 start_codon:yes stop_codon:yes gene_type:complete